MTIELRERIPGQQWCLFNHAGHMVAQIQRQYIDTAKPGGWNVLDDEWTLMLQHEGAKVFGKFTSPEDFAAHVNMMPTLREPVRMVPREN